MLQLEFLIKPWEKNQSYLREKSYAVPRTTSPRLRFREISRDATEAFLQGDACTPGDQCGQHPPVRDGKAGPQQERKTLRVSPGKWSEVALEARPPVPTATLGPPDPSKGCIHP